MYIHHPGRGLRAIGEGGCRGAYDEKRPRFLVYERPPHLVRVTQSWVEGNTSAITCIHPAQQAQVPDLLFRGREMAVYISSKPAPPFSLLPKLAVILHFNLHLHSRRPRRTTRNIGEIWGSGGFFFRLRTGFPHRNRQSFQKRGEPHPPSSRWSTPLPAS